MRRRVTDRRATGRTVTAWAGGVLALGGLAGCGAGSTRSSAPPPPDTVVIQNYAFHPSTITVKVGSTVTWQDKDSVPHTVTDAGGTGTMLNSPSLSKGSTYRYTFNTPGTYRYVCTIHPYMKATVVVQ